MRHKNNPYMTLNYGVLGKGGAINDYTLKIGTYGTWSSSKYWEVYHARQLNYERKVTSAEALMLFNRIKAELNRRKDITLLKKGDHQFAKDRHNFLVYSYLKPQQYYRERGRTFISFEPIKGEEGEWSDVVYDYLPKIEKPTGG